jgi:hypothetical protein
MLGACGNAHQEAFTFMPFATPLSHIFTPTFSVRWWFSVSLHVSIVRCCFIPVFGSWLTLPFGGCAPQFREDFGDEPSRAAMTIMVPKKDDPTEQVTTLSRRCCKIK